MRSDERMRGHAALPTVKTADDGAEKSCLGSVTAGSAEVALLAF
jgi:hypothetical protein